MLLRDLIARPDLRLALLTGAEHGLDQPVTGIVTTDLLDPSRYLSGGEIVLSGLMWYRGPATSDRFVAALARSGVVALGAGEAALGRVPTDLLKACRKHAMPLFKVPVEISFMAIVEAAVPAVWSERATGLQGVLSRHRTMITALATGAHLPDVMPKIASELGMECWVLTPTGSVVAGTGTLPSEVSRAVLTQFHSAARLPQDVRLSPGQMPIRIYRAGGTPGRRLDAWCVACRGGASNTPAELVSLVELHRASLDERRRVERSLTTDLLRAMRRDSDSATLRAHLTTCNLTPGSTTVVVAASLTAPEKMAVPSMLDEITTAAVGEHDQRSAATDLDGAAIALVQPADMASFPERLRGVAQVLEPSLHGGQLALGVSSPVHDVDGLRDALAQAMNMARLAATQRQPIAVMANDRVASHTMLLAAVPAQTKLAFQDHLLGPLLRYDREKRAELVPTLCAFLEASGSWKDCARQLHIHVNTLRYRMQRVQQLTGRDLNRFGDCVDLFLALQVIPSTRAVADPAYLPPG